jgi:hypothetical protein
LGVTIVLVSSAPPAHAAKDAQIKTNVPSFLTFNFLLP